MLPDGSFADYIVKNERDTDDYQVFQGETALVTFAAGKNGEWSVVDNPGNIDGDLQARLREQLKGLRS